jgi:hypothetical protein
VQANLNATVPTDVMHGTAFEADELYQNAGEKQHAPSRSSQSAPPISMPFGSMVAFMVKWAIASIPAFIILFLLGVIAMGVLTMMTGFGAGLLRR